jgi:hypothetical protein
MTTNAPVLGIDSDFVSGTFKSQDLQYRGKFQATFFMTPPDAKTLDGANGKTRKPAAPSR